MSLLGFLNQIYMFVTVDAVKRIQKLPLVDVRVLHAYKTVRIGVYQQINVHIWIYKYCECKEFPQTVLVSCFPQNLFLPFKKSSETQTFMEIFNKQNSNQGLSYCNLLPRAVAVWSINKIKENKQNTKYKPTLISTNGCSSKFHMQNLFLAL